MQNLEPEVTKNSATGRTKRVMAPSLEEQDQPERITRQRTRVLLSACEDTTAGPQDGFTEDGSMATDVNAHANNQNEQSIEGK